MQNATYIALSGQMAMQRQMDVVANNLANLSTPGFKGEQMLFSEYVTQSPSTEPLSYVEDAGTTRDLRQGALSKTGNPLDFAIEGSGYFTVQTPLGQRYTRNGHFQIDGQSELITSQGYPVLSDNGQPIVLPANARDVTVAPDGTISVSQAGSTLQPVLGKLQVVDFASPQAVTPAANGLWVTDQTPQPSTTATVQQGMSEQSNVQPVVELTRMLTVSRGAGFFKTFLDQEDQRRGNAIDKLSQSSSS
jgi:flagellar basal-body rod protein FlgF